MEFANNEHLVNKTQFSPIHLNEKNKNSKWNKIVNSDTLGESPVLRNVRIVLWTSESFELLGTWKINRKCNNFLLFLFVCLFVCSFFGLCLFVVFILRSGRDKGVSWAFNSLYLCYPFDLWYSKCWFSTDIIKQRSCV